MGKISGNGERASLRPESDKSKSQDKQKSAVESPNSSLGYANSAMTTLRVLEPRILLDAAGVETADMVVGNVAMEQADNFLHQLPDTPAPFNTDEFFIDTSLNESDEPVGDLNDPAADEEGLAGTETDSPASIVFIDSAVEDMDGIIAEIDPSFEIVILDSTKDGVEQISGYLANLENVDAVHIISHGRSGTLDLGTAVLAP